MADATWLDCAPCKATETAPVYVPPRPRSLPALAALARTILQGDGDLLNLLPAYAYKSPVRFIGYSRRQILIVNDPGLVRQVMVEEAERFPKSDLMVGALAPLVGDSLFVSHGARWRRQRHLIDPAFSQLRVERAFGAMDAAVAAYEQRLDRASQTGKPISLDLAMSHLTADIICRTVFSHTLESETAREVFEDFLHFERTVAHVEIRRLIFDPAWTETPQSPEVLAACQRIRGHIGDLLDTHLSPGSTYDDVAAMVAMAEDPANGARFSREELIDQLGVFFLAGHETTASALTWTLYALADRPELAARARAEVASICGSALPNLADIKRMPFLRNLFKEALRLYPPITFIPRVAAAPCQIGGYALRRGAMVMIAPWAIHRHHALWDRPDEFDPDRWNGPAPAQGTYLPFGYGPRVCIGAGFATLESALILARLVRRFAFEILPGQTVRPVARLTTRPKEQIMAQVRTLA
ncbi:MAG: cytochrome P450 [Pseudomonadota bacterium]